MKLLPVSTMKALPIFFILRALFLIFFYTSAFAAAAQRTQTAVDPVQAKQAIQANQQVRQATRSLEREVNNGIGRLQNLARDAGKVRDQHKRAKELADKANDASFKALEAAKKCDKATFGRLSKEAERLMAQSQKAKAEAEKQEQDLNKEVEQTADKVNKHIEGLRNSLEEGLKAAERAGLKEDSVVVGNLRDAQRLLEEEIAKQSRAGTEAKQFRDEGSLQKLTKAVDQFTKELAKIRKEGEGLSISPEGMKERLDALG